ncbi:MAG: adenine-specific DNA-methyltransferase [Polaribacter sp.]|jgi:adenine-specific DNA-methyltransferase
MNKSNKVNQNNNFLKNNIITYLGNKRTQLPFINNEISNLISQDRILKNKSTKDIKILDIFSGSGIVARSFKNKGYSVLCNDLEAYSAVINKAIVGTNKSELELIFSCIYEKLVAYYSIHNIQFKKSDQKSDYKKVLEILNSVRDLGDKNIKPFFQVHYAPKITSEADFDTERLFYTQENGRFIDSVLDALFEFELNNTPIFSEKSRNIILADLLHLMTKNINSSGHMKSYHQGFGGKGKDALNRIMADMVLTELPLIDAENGEAFTCDATTVMSDNDLNVDIIYCDSPYNQHQYSGNYHLLTTAVNNRDLKDISGKGGIRKDQNKSDFCYKKVVELNGFKHKKAYHAFESLLNDVSDRTKYLVVSYNQEGILSQSELIDVLSCEGKHSVSVNTNKHDKFRGGKNTNISNAVVEYIFIVEFNKVQSLTDVQQLKASLKLETEKILLKDKYINTDKLPKNVKLTQFGSTQIIQFDSGQITLDTNNKIISESFKNYDTKLFTLISDIEFQNKEEMMSFYIKNNHHKAAIKLLSSFKIKCKRHLFEEYSALLDAA